MLEKTIKTEVTLGFTEDIFKLGINQIFLFNSAHLTSAGNRAVLRNYLFPFLNIVFTSVVVIIDALDVLGCIIYFF